MQYFNPLQLVLRHHVIEQHKKFFFVPSLSIMFPIANKPQVEACLQTEYWEKSQQEFDKTGDIPDLTVPKAKGEFLVCGSYNAPNSEPVNSGNAKVTLGEMSKELLISGERTWKKRFSPQPFTTMPLSYANAFGAPEYELNRVGKGYKQEQMHNIEVAGKEVISKSDKKSPGH